MNEKLCVAPAEVTMSKVFNKDANSVVVAEATKKEHILFYHVDSCMAIGFVLNDGSIIGGHVSMVSLENEMRVYGNAEDMCTTMLEMLWHRQVAKLIMVGGNDWRNDQFGGGKDSVEYIRGAVDCADSLYVDARDYSLDVCMYTAQKEIMVWKWPGYSNNLIKSRSLLAKDNIYRKPFNQIVGVMDERVR